MFPSAHTSIAALADACRTLERVNANHDPGKRAHRGHPGADNYTVQKTAHHECGHAIAAMLVWPKANTIKSLHLASEYSTDWAGLARIVDPEGASFFDRGIVSAAGPCADAEFQARYRIIRPLRNTGDAIDRGDIEKLIGATFDDSTWEVLCQRAARIVTENWRAISATAQKLVEYGQLDGDEFQRIAFANW